MKVLIIDNFLKNPDEIRNIGLNLKYRTRGNDEGWEGQRSNLVESFNKKLSDEICRKIISSYFCIEKFDYKAYLYYHKTKKNDLNDTQWINDRVHKDDGIIACLIYLTPNAPMNAGTQTYVYDENKDVFIPDVVMSNKYNRMVAYPGNVLHSAMNYFDTRLVILFWLYELKIN